MTFTVKYLYPSGEELISGPYAQVSTHWVDQHGNKIDNVHDWDSVPGGPDCSRHLVVTACGPSQGSMTFGPVMHPGDVPATPGRLYVMNESGATVASYIL